MEGDRATVHAARVLYPVLNLALLGMVAQVMAVGDLLGREEAW